MTFRLLIILSCSLCLLPFPLPSFISLYVHHHNIFFKKLCIYTLIYLFACYVLMIIHSFSFTFFLSSISFFLHSLPSFLRFPKSLALSHSPSHCTFTMLYLLLYVNEKWLTIQSQTQNSVLLENRHT